MTLSTFRHVLPAVQHASAEFMTITPALLRYPSLTTTVPKEFVHRVAVAEVLLTDWGRRDATHFSVTAQWPRGHSFFGPVGGTHYDPLMVTETIRQAGTLLAHAEFNVPLDHQFVIQDLRVSVRPEHARVGSTPAGVEVEVTYTELRQRRIGHAGSIEAVILRDGEIVATGSAIYTCTSPAVYKRVRGNRGLCGDRPQLQLTAPVSPQSVGRMSPMDVVLSPTQDDGRWQLRVDTRHPVLFDHPVDHIPGMVLIEAARQATTAVLNRSALLPLRIENTFQHYTELDTPCIIEARQVPATMNEVAVLVTGTQNGEQVFSSLVTAPAAVFF
ncbi:ScbA/BarX family gamma-butyrolactone biosynthesis protein [Streptomyces violascens]|uniref:ScbA/BarX family gamma-butyrolactone biosynthesis protein n=1 Tax=Streptomyces violascens TaxID=67381 RepID=UPI00369FBD1A